MKIGQFVCPKCGGQLAFWREEYIETRIKISKRTGKLYKKRNVVKGYGEMQGIMCTSCGISYNWVTGSGEKIFPEELLDDIDSINF